MDIADQISLSDSSDTDVGVGPKRHFAALRFGRYAHLASASHCNCNTFAPMSGSRRRSSLCG